MNRTILSMALALGTVACTQSSLLEDPRFATGSNTLAASADHARLYNTNFDEGTITRIDREAATTDELAVGSEPMRIARAGDRLYVTLRGERSVAIIEDGPAGMVQVGTIPVGSEPYGVVASQDGERVYVAVSLEDQVVAIDTASNEVIARFVVPGQPRWLALHPDGGTLYVANGRGEGVVTVVGTGHTTLPDGEAGEQGVLDVIPLPITNRDADNGFFELTPRVTGDMAVDPTGETLVVPALYVDNHSQEDVQPSQDPTFQYYMNPEPGIGRFNAAVVQIPIVRDGGLTPEAATPIFVASFAQSDFGTSTMRSYPNAVTVSPDGEYYAVSMEASDAVVMVGRLGYNSGVTSSSWIRPSPEVDPVQHGFANHPHAAIQTTAGPRGVLFVDKGDRPEAWVHGFLGLNVQPLDARSGMELVRNRGMQGLDDIESSVARFSESIEVTESVLPPDVRAGRRLFYQANDPALVASGSGVSCSTCHYDGRDDGLTWQLGPAVRQTPSLAGRVSDTHPVTWTNDIVSVAAEARETSLIRMGGVEMTDGQYESIAAFVDYTREPDHVARDAADPLVAQGQAIFEREDVGCSSCHTGAALTDNAYYAMYGLESVNTPSLRGVVATGPYLHDGSADTLRDVLELSRTGAMGDTSMLSAAEMDALEAYLKSL